MGVWDMVAREAFSRADGGKNCCTDGTDTETRCRWPGLCISWYGSIDAQHDFRCDVCVESSSITTSSKVFGAMYEGKTAKHNGWCRFRTLLHSVFTPCTRSATVDYGLRDMRRTKMKFEQQGLTTAPIHCIEAGIRLYISRNLPRSNATFRSGSRVLASRSQWATSIFCVKDWQKNQFVNKYSIRRWFCSGL